MELDEALKDADSAMFNPPGIEVKHFTNQEVKFMTDDVMDELLADGRLLTDMIYGELIYEGEDIALTPAQSHGLGSMLAALFSCRHADMPDVVEDLRYMFTRNLTPKATAPALELLEEGEEL